MLTFVISCLFVGLFVGFFSGLFGIGGGLVVVPALLYLLPDMGVSQHLLMTTAVGTSFATIVITSFSAAQRHYKNGNVNLSAIKILAPALMITVFCVVQIFDKIPQNVSTKLFACLMIYLAFKMAFKTNREIVIKQLTTLSAAIGGIVIGLISSIAGIGGGSFIVPFLTSRGVVFKQSIGCSALCGSLLGISGTVSAAVNGWNVATPEYSLGFVYLPAVVCITATSFFTSKLGADVAAKIETNKLKKFFAVFLVVVAIRLMFFV